MRPLTQREFQAARCIKRGLGQSKAAVEMGIKFNYAKKLYCNVREKTGARSTAQLVYWMNCPIFLEGLMVKSGG